MSKNLSFEPTASSEYFFLSYNSDDAERVGQLASRLAASGVPLWYDEDLQYGHEWERQLAERIVNCQAVILFFTKSLLYKDTYVIKECEIAKFKHKVIYVIMMDFITEEEVPTNAIPWYMDIRRLHCIEVSKINSLDEQITKIIHALEFEYSTDAPDNIQHPSELRKKTIPPLPHPKASMTSPPKAPSTPSSKTKKITSIISSLFILLIVFSPFLYARFCALVLNDEISRISITADTFHVSRDADIQATVVNSDEYATFIQSEQLQNPIMYDVELLDSERYSRNMLRYRYIVPVPDSIDPDNMVVYCYQNLHFKKVNAHVYKVGDRKNDYGYDVVAFDWFEIGPFIIAEKP